MTGLKLAAGESQATPASLAGICGRQQTFGQLDQSICIGAESAMCDFDCVSARQTLDGFREIGALRHHCSVDENRYHPHTSLQCLLNFNSHVVVGAVKSPTACLRRQHPSWADDHEHDSAVLHCFADHFTEIQTRFDGIDIHEDSCWTELLTHPVREPASEVRCVVTSVTDKHADRGAFVRARA